MIKPKIFLSNLDINRLIHGGKTIIACLIGFLVSGLLHFHTNQWVIITILVVMCAQSRIGALLQKSYMRFLGTLMGAVIAIMTLKLFGDYSLPVITALCISAFLFSYLATGTGAISEAGTIGAVTVAIILIGQQPTLELAVLRFLEIALGIVIAFLVSRFIWPIHSKSRLLHTIQATLNDLHKLYQTVMQIENSMDNEPLEEKIIAGLGNQRKLFDEVARESFKTTPLVTEFKAILRYERELLRGISLMNHALLRMAEGSRVIFNEFAIVQQFHQQFSNALIQMIAQLLGKNQTEQPILVIDLPDNWQHQIKETALAKHMSADILHIDSFLFCAQRLIQQLQLLEMIIRKIRSSECNNNNQ